MSKIRMKRLSSERREQMMAWLQIVVGCIIGAAAYPMFLEPCNIAPGGLSGVAMIIGSFTGWPVGITSLVLNIPLFIVGYRSMGRVFAFRSLVATILFSLAIDGLKLLGLPAVTIGEEAAMLGCIFGGVLLGVGLGMILRGGATTGGSDMAARVVHRYLPFLSVGMFVFLIDCVVVIAAAFCFDVMSALYALICIFINGKVIDVVMLGLSKNKACFIMTSAWERVNERVLQEMDRGVTLLEARGGYTGERRPVVMCVLPPQEVARIKAIVRETDGSAFMFITEAHEALGEGFSHLAGEN
ncbi:MAG: YitT family protein [Clostridia bacterium]|nr:YitT family protein [Clostridia bacterium]